MPASKTNYQPKMDAADFPAFGAMPNSGQASTKMVYQKKSAQTDSDVGLSGPEAPSQEAESTTTSNPMGGMPFFTNAV